MGFRDISAVVAIESQSFTHPWTYWLFFQELFSPQRYYIVAEKERKIVGYAGMGWVLGEGHITTIAVEEKERCAGIGSTLLDNIISEALNVGLIFLTLEVRESNIPAQKLYKKFGFQIEGKRRGYYDSPKEDAVIMTLYLRRPE